MGHGITCGGRGGLDGVAFLSHSLLGHLQSVSSSEAVSDSSCGEGRLMALLRGIDLLWGDASEAALASTRLIPLNWLWPLECLPSGASSPFPAGDAGLPVGEPRAICPGTFWTRLPVGLTKGAFSLASFSRTETLCPNVSCLCFESCYFLGFASVLGTLSSLGYC